VASPASGQRRNAPACTITWEPTTTTSIAATPGSAATVTQPECTGGNETPTVSTDDSTWAAAWERRMWRVTPMLRVLHGQHADAITGARWTAIRSLSSCHGHHAARRIHGFPVGHRHGCDETGCSTSSLHATDRTRAAAVSGANALAACGPWPSQNSEVFFAHAATCGTRHCKCNLSKKWWPTGVALTSLCRDWRTFPGRGPTHLQYRAAPHPL